MNIIRYSIRSFFTNEYYSIIRFASKRLFVATLPLPTPGHQPMCYINPDMGHHFYSPPSHRPHCIIYYGKLDSGHGTGHREVIKWVMFSVSQFSHTTKNGEPNWA